MRYDMIMIMIITTTMVKVKPAGEIREEGLSVTLRVNGPNDLKRDLLKVIIPYYYDNYMLLCIYISIYIVLCCNQSDTASLRIPQLELELTPGTLGGKYTTLVFRRREREENRRL